MGKQLEATGQTMIETTVIDAHAFLWFLDGSEKLSAEGRRRLSNPDANLLFPSIAVAEACWVIAKGKSDTTLEKLRGAIESDKRIAVVPLDLELIFAAAAIPGDLEMHDRLIAATTARALAADKSVVLLTCDDPLRNANIVPTVW